MGRFAAAVLLLCKSLVWICPAYCLDAAPSLTTQTSGVQAGSGHQHHQPDYVQTEPADGSVAPVLTSERCADCAPVERAALTARGRFSSNVLAYTIPPGTGHIWHPMPLHATPQSSFIRQPDTSPPPGIAPLRI